MHTHAFYYLLSIYKSFHERAKFKISLFEMQMRMCTKQGSNSEYEDRYWPMLLWRRLSRHEPKYFKSEVSKTEMSKTEVSNAKYRKPKYRKSKYQNRNCGTRKAKIETRKSKRERRKSKLFLFSAQVHVGLRVEVRVSKSRSPKAFYLIARYLYLLKTKFENRNLGVRNAL